MRFDLAQADWRIHLKDVVVHDDIMIAGRLHKRVHVLWLVLSAGSVLLRSETHDFDDLKPWTVLEYESSNRSLTSIDY